MSSEHVESTGQALATLPSPKVDLAERRRLIVHLGRLFSRRYDMQVLPSGQKGLWACSMDPKTNQEVTKYLRGQRPTLDDMPEEAFKPTQILYDEQSMGEMPIDNINTLLRHESGHAKYTDFRLMIEGQKQVKNEGYLPTSFWLMFEGIEDPRVNIREGDESPAIDRMIKENQGRDLQERLTESPLSKRPLMLQMAYDCLHYYVHGTPIPELQGTEIDTVFQQARPLIDRYFQNTDYTERKDLQKQIWDVVKQIEQKGVEQEEKKEMAKRRKQGQQQAGQGSGSQQGEDQQSQGQSGSGESEGQGTGQSSGQESSGGQQQPVSQDGSPPPQKKGLQGIMDKLRKAFKGQDSTSNSPQNSPSENPSSSSTESKEKNEKTPSQPEEDLQDLTPAEMQEIQDAIDQLSPQERAELLKQARQALDEKQKEAAEKDIPKTMKLEKDKKTGQWEATPQMADEKKQKEAQKKFDEAREEVEAEETAEAQKIAELQRQEELRQKERQAAEREKIEMLKNGFDPESEREKYLAYRDLEESMRSSIHNFKKAMEAVVPRFKEPDFEGTYFGGKKIDKRALVRKVPIRSEQFWQRQEENPTGDTRLYIGLLIDNSGSMSGKKMEEARKTAIFFSRVSQMMQVPFMMSVFGDGAHSIKSLRENFDDPSKKIKPKLIDATDASGGSTNLHAGLELTIEAMNEEKRRLRDSHGLIFVITDGGANAGVTGRGLKQYIEDNKGRLTFKAIGLSNSENERTTIQTQLGQYFGESNCAFPETFEDLPNSAFMILRKNMIQFQRFLV